MNKRNSSFELFKLIGMVMIVVFHCYLTVINKGNFFYPVLSQAVDFASLPKGITKFILLIVGYLGNFGNLIFFTCSIWFLCENESIHLRKVIRIILTAFVISLLHLAIIPSVYEHITLPKNYYWECFFPISYSHNWFLSCYLIIYLIHGGLNTAIEQTRRSTHFLTVVVSFSVYSMLTLYGTHDFYFNSTLMVCITIYLLVAYVRRFAHSKLDGFKLMMAGIVGFICLVISKQIGFPTFIRDEGLFYWNKFSNPFLILIVLGSVIISSHKKIYNPTINYLSGLSLILYLTHENKLFREIVRPIVWDAISRSLTGVHLLGRFILFACIILVYAFGISMIFSEMVMPWIGKTVDILECKLPRLWEAFCAWYFEKADMERHKECHRKSNSESEK